MREAARLDKNELRFSRYGALQTFLEQTGQGSGILSQRLIEKAFRSIGSDLKVPVLNFKDPTITSTRTVTIADDENESAFYTVTFNTISFGFTQVPAMFLNNEIDIQRDFNHKLEACLLKAFSIVDSSCVSALDAAKTQVLGDNLGKYTFASDTLRATLAQQDQIVGDINPLNHTNDYYGPYTLVMNPGADSVVRNVLFEKGANNSENKTYQYSDKIFRETNRLANAVDTKATMYSISGSQCGIMFRVEREALLGTRMQDGTEWGVDTLPFFDDIRTGTYFYESKGDYNAIAGAATADMTRAYKQHFGWSFDYAVVTPYNSDPAAIASPILKIEVATS